MTIGSDRYNRTKALKVMPDNVRKQADEISVVWNLGGHMEYSLMFYGYYSRETFFGETVRYRVPVAYFLSNLFVLGYSFLIILRKMAANARTSKLTAGKTEQYVFNWKTFTGWDFTIGNGEAAGNVHMANVIKFREAIAEYAVNMKRKYACLQILIRMFANLLVFLMLGFSVWAILAVSQIRETDTFIKQNAVSITVSFITLIFPNIFELIGKLERYHPRTALRIQLARILCLYIVNYYTLIVSLMMKLRDLEGERRALEKSQMAAMQMLNEFRPIFRNRLMRGLLGTSTLSPNLAQTTPTSPPVWTTMFSDFGPIGVSNPKAVVSKDTSLHNTTIVVTHVIGPNVAWRNRELQNYKTYRVSRLEHVKLTNYTEMCWETQIGQEITKLVIMDLLMTIAAILVIDFFRGLMCRYCNMWWFWNLEKTFPEYGEFKVAENVLHLVNNQGMIWLGLFFVPMLPMINNIKLIILMYIRGWAVMTCNIPARQIFRASRSSNFYLMLLLLMLFLCTLPVGYVIASRTPSKGCGPFGDQPHFYSIITDVLHENLNASLVDALKYITSPGIVIPLLLLLLLIIYFLFALVRGLREANHDLSSQLVQERTEEKKKIFELAGGKRNERYCFQNRRLNRHQNRSTATILQCRTRIHTQNSNPAFPDLLLVVVDSDRLSGCCLRLIKVMQKRQNLNRNHFSPYRFVNRFLFVSVSLMRTSSSVGSTTLIPSMLKKDTLALHTSITSQKMTKKKRSTNQVARNDAACYPNLLVTPHNLLDLGILDENLKRAENPRNPHRLMLLRFQLRNFTRLHRS